MREKPKVRGRRKLKLPDTREREGWRNEKAHISQTQAHVGYTEQQQKGGNLGARVLLL
jgi:hypothetical protein